MSVLTILRGLTDYSLQRPCLCAVPPGVLQSVCLLSEPGVLYIFPVIFTFKVSICLSLPVSQQTILLSLSSSFHACFDAVSSVSCCEFQTFKEF